MKFGFCTAPTCVEACSDIQVDYIELYMSEVMDMTPKQFEAFRKRIAGNPIEVAIVRLPRFLKIVRSKEELEFAYFYFEECIKRAKQLGVLVCVFGSGDARSANLCDKYEKKRLAFFLKRANAFCKTINMSLGIEAMSSKMCDTLNLITQTSSFLMDMGLEEIGVVIDNYHMEENNESIADLTRVHRITHVHLSNPVNREPPQESDLYNYERLFEILSECGYSKRISVESNDIYNPNRAGPAIDYLRNVLGNCETSL